MEAFHYLLSSTISSLQIVESFLRSTDLGIRPLNCSSASILLALTLLLPGPIIEDAMVHYFFILPIGGFLTIFLADSASSWSLFWVIRAAKSVIRQASPSYTARFLSLFSAVCYGFLWVSKA